MFSDLFVPPAQNLAHLQRSFWRRELSVFDIFTGRCPWANSQGRVSFWRTRLLYHSCRYMQGFKFALLLSWGFMSSEVWRCGPRRVGRKLFLHFKRSNSPRSLLLDCLTIEDEGDAFFDTLRTTRPSIFAHIVEDINRQIPHLFELPSSSLHM